MGAEFQILSHLCSVLRTWEECLSWFCSTQDNKLLSIYKTLKVNTTSLRFHNTVSVCRGKHTLQPLVLAVVSVHVICSIGHAQACGSITFCLIFSTDFNIMSAIPVHQSHILPQKIDSHEGFGLILKGGSCKCGQNEYLFCETAICTHFGAIYC